MRPNGMPGAVPWMTPSSSWSGSSPA
jgi:hypothetical protein